MTAIVPIRRALLSLSDKSGLDEEGGGEYASGKVAIDAVFDSVSVVTTFKKELAKAGVIFCSISEAMREHPELVRKYLGTVVPAYETVMKHARRRLRRWLGEKHKVRRGEYARFPTAHLHRELGLHLLPGCTTGLPRANP